jgi:hypothetical protein
MNIDCPACGKKNNGSPECIRCGCELEVLRNIAIAADRALDRGRQCLVQGEATAAAAEAMRSWQLKKSPAAARLAFLAYLAIGDFTKASQWYALSSQMIAGDDC